MRLKNELQKEKNREGRWFRIVFEGAIAQDTGANASLLYSHPILNVLSTEMYISETSYLGIGEYCANSRSDIA